MLAFMPPSPPLADLHPSTSGTTSTMSVAILPSSPATYNQPAIAALLPPVPSPSKRPKLSLTTTNVPSVFGKRSTSLRLETLSATSPTVRNTFTNTYRHDSLVSCAGLHKPALTPLATSDITPVKERLPTLLPNESSDSPDCTSSSAVSTTSISTVESLPTECPYKLAYNITSILTNSPIPRKHGRRRSFTRARPMFPDAKKVAFRAPLTEEIKTQTYTLRHSDLESSSSTISTLELSPPEMTTPNMKQEAQEKQSKAGTEAENVASPKTGDKRDSSDEEDSDTCPATPVAGRMKKHRQWVWTLGPVGESAAEQKQRPVPGIGHEKMKGA